MMVFMDDFPVQDEELVYSDTSNTSITTSLHNTAHENPNNIYEILKQTIQYGQSEY